MKYLIVDSQNIKNVIEEIEAFPVQDLTKGELGTSFVGSVNGELVTVVSSYYSTFKDKEIEEKEAFLGQQLTSSNPFMHLGYLFSEPNYSLSDQEWAEKKNKIDSLVENELNDKTTKK